MVVVTAACALPTVPIDDPRELAVRAWIGSVAAAVAGAVLGVLVVSSLLESPAGTVFGLVALPVAASLMWPLATCVRRTRLRG